MQASIQAQKQLFSLSTLVITVFIAIATRTIKKKPAQKSCKTSLLLSPTTIRNRGIYKIFEQGFLTQGN
jgi:hypothetical protein